MVDTFEDFVLLQYEKHLELWRLGDTVPVTNMNDLHDGDFLPLLRKPKKYVHLKSKNDLFIVSSSLGPHPSNKKSSANSPFYLYLTYSDLNVIHIYKVEISSRHVLEPKIKIDKQNSLPLACGNRPAVLMKLYPQTVTSRSSALDTELRMCYLTNKSYLQCLKLDETGFILESTIQCVNNGNIAFST